MRPKRSGVEPAEVSNELLIILSCILEASKGPAKLIRIISIGNHRIRIQCDRESYRVAEIFDFIHESGGYTEMLAPYDQGIYDIVDE